MRITIERSLSAEAVEEFLPIYRESFAHLAELSAAKQVLKNDEFRSSMRSLHTLKFCGWDDTGSLVALSLLVHDLRLVPWLSVPFFAHNWPERIDSNRIAYLLTILVDPDRRHEPWMSKLIEALSIYAAEGEVLMLFDCCGYNIETFDVPNMITALTARNTLVEPHLVDIQHYYAYVVLNAGKYDLAKIAAEGVIDLRVPSLESTNDIDLREPPILAAELSRETQT